jgi:hypothetical protein
LPTCGNKAIQANIDGLYILPIAAKNNLQFLISRYFDEKWRQAGASHRLGDLKSLSIVAPGAFFSTATR